jgi:NAD(P)-dependent dehydrogenase (short-subunit alcohol dehydrogenase family)
VDASPRARLHDLGSVITGAASGIGASTAETFVREGARVVLVDADSAALQALVARLGGRATACVADLAGVDAVERVLASADASLPAIDVLVNDAGVSSKTPFLDATEDEWDAVMRVNAYAAARLAVACAAGMIERGRGCILNVSSISGLRGGPPQSVYGISKGAMLGLTRELHAALSPAGVRVNAVLPGVIDTPMVRRDVAEGGDAGGSELAAWIAEAVPIGRIGDPQEVAGVLAFLASEQAGAIQGAFVPVEGGFLSA